MSGAYSRNKGARAERPAGNWKQVEGWPPYWVSDDGRVWSESSGRLLKGLTSRDGYNKIHLSYSGRRKQMFRHRLVAEAFVSGTGDQVRHLDGDKANNNASNLAWGTCQENILDKWRHGTMPHGSSHHSATIPVEDVPAIRRSRESNSAIARRYGVSRTAIYAIKRGISYGWV